MIKYRRGRACSKAYTVSKVWRLGIHIFLNGEDLIFRVCYLRNSKGTYYAQISIKVREELDCGC